MKMTTLVNEVSKKVIGEGLAPQEAEAYLRKRLLAAEKDNLSKADYGRLIKLVVPRLASEVAKKNNFKIFVEEYNLDSNYSVVSYIDNYGNSGSLVKFPNSINGLYKALYVRFTYNDPVISIAFNHTLNYA